MGKPTHIILVRHGESEGNLDHSLFRIIPDHKIKLTPRGIRQAYDAGLRMRRDLIRCDERVQFYVSPYERTRQTYVAAKRAITDGCKCEWGNDGNGERIVYREEPRLREQGVCVFFMCIFFFVYIIEEIVTGFWSMWKFQRH